jgi:hypothetical protein
MRKEKQEQKKDHRCAENVGRRLAVTHLEVLEAPGSLGLLRWKGEGRRKKKKEEREEDEKFGLLIYPPSPSL